VEAGERKVVEEMVREHRELTTAISEVDRAVDRNEGVRDQISALGSQLRAHLEHEERDVLPLIEQHLTRADWRAFLETERRRTPMRERPDFIGWLLHDASDADRAAVLAELPPPGRLVATRALEPRYASTHDRGRDSHSVTVG
jgi:hypothetical protein